MTKDKAKNVTRCVICEMDVRPILELGNQPLANSLVQKVDQDYEIFPLGLSFCPACAHAQLTHFADPNDIFVDYLYASGTSQTLKDFFSWFADRVVNSLGADIDILEIASNDGSLLDAFATKRLSPTGIDPAQNLCEVARNKGHNVKCGFFPQVRPDSKCDLIVAMNVTAHTPDPRAFVRGMAECLRPGGMAIIQTSQANMISNGEFDTIYHEHYSFFSASSMSTLAQSAGLLLERIELVSVHGTSFLFTLRKPGGDPKRINFENDHSSSFYVDMPSPMPALLDQNCLPEVADAEFSKFSQTAKQKMAETADLLAKLQASGKTLGLVGVAAKALTFVHAAGIKPQLFFDEAPLKIGKFVPGAPTSIRSLATLSEMDEDVVLLIGAWNFAEELTRKIGDVVKNTPMKDRLTLVVHQPNLRIL